MKGKYIYLAIVIVTLILAFLFRVNFLLRYPQAPVAWDAAGYNIQAKEFAAAFSAWPDRELFTTHFKKAYEMALPKCELYPLFLSGVYLAAGVNFDAVRIAQAILGTLSLLFLYLIAARIFSRRVAVIAIIMGAVYIPFVLSEGRLLTETLAVFVFMLTIWLLVLTLERGSWWLILVSGFVTALMVITRTFFQYVYLLYWPMLVLGLAMKKREERRARGVPSPRRKLLRSITRPVRWFPARSLLYPVGLAVIIVPRLFWTPQVDRYHRSFISGSWRNGLAMYCGIYPPTAGLQTTTDPGGEILRSITPGRYPGAADDRYFKAYLRILLEKPAEAIPVLLAKGRLFYQRAYNDFLQSYVIPPPWIDILNRVILITGLFGAALIPGLGRRSWPIIISLIYGWAMCFAADVESRYTLPLIPLMIAAGVWFCDRAVFGLCSLFRAGREGGRHLFLILLAPVCLLVLALAARPGFSMMALPGLSFPGAHRLRVFIAVLFILSLIPLLFRVYRPIMAGWRRVLGAVFPPAFILLVYFSALKVHPTAHEWKIRLQEPGQMVRQTFILPEDLRQYRSADLKLDLVSGPVRRYALEVSLDGEVVRRFEGGLTPDPASWVPQDKRRAFPIYLRQTKRSMPDIRQWYTIPLDLKKLEGKKTIEVEVRFFAGDGRQGSYVDLYGDYRFSDDRGLFEGPTFSKEPGRLSLYKYLVDDDWRIWEQAPVAPISRAEYAGPGKSRDDDLSPCPGIQSGEFRIFLLLSRQKSPPGNYPVAVKHREYLTEKSILADYYNLQIWEVNPWKRKSDRMELSAAHAAAGEAGGFRLVVYADTDRDEKPDRLVAESPYLTATEKGDWSNFTFTTKEKNIFVGMSWPRGSKTTVYYERLLWPDDLFPETMFYRTGPNAPTAYPVLTNMRLRFLDEEK